MKKDAESRNDGLLTQLAAIAVTGTAGLAVTWVNIRNFAHSWLKSTGLLDVAISKKIQARKTASATLADKMKTMLPDAAAEKAALDAYRLRESRIERVYFGRVRKAYNMVGVSDDKLFKGSVQKFMKLDKHDMGRVLALGITVTSVMLGAWKGFRHKQEILQKLDILEKRLPPKDESFTGRLDREQADATRLAAAGAGPQRLP